MKAISRICCIAAIALVSRDALAGGKVGITNSGPTTATLSSITLAGNIQESAAETTNFSRASAIAAGATLELESSMYDDPRVTQTVWEIPGKGGAPSRQVVMQSDEVPTTLPLYSGNSETPTTLPRHVEGSVMASPTFNVRYTMTPDETAAAPVLPLFSTITVVNGVDTTGTFPSTVIFMNDTTDAPANGTLVCRATIATTVMWSHTDVDGKPGTGGLVPALSGCGLLAANQTVSLALTNAAPNVSTFLVVGFAEVNASLPEGILVPSPDIVLTGIVTDGNGEATTPFTFGSAFPSGVELYVQQWVLDTGAAQGVSHTNGLRGMSP